MSYASKVLEFATKAHEGQVRKNSQQPYITHPIAVAMIAKGIYLAKWNWVSWDHQNNIERINSIAFLHDVLEDCPDIRQVGTFLSTLDGITASDVKVISDAVQLLTRSDKRIAILGHLERIKSNFYARIVKLADLQHNMKDLQPGNLRDKYELCEWYLSN